MGTIHHKEKWECNQYLSGAGPPVNQKPNFHICEACWDTWLHEPSQRSDRKDWEHDMMANQIKDLTERPNGGRAGEALKNEQSIVGDQPEGDMKWISLPRSLPCYPHCGTIRIEYSFNDGIQTEKHPKPGRPFTGFRTVAYLPDDREGNELLRLLKRAFDQGLTFTVASGSNGSETVTWSDIPHCTGFTDPEPYFLMTVKQVLKSKGIE